MISVRKAEVKDIDDILELLKEVFEIHLKLRPDLFIPNTTKYTKEKLKEIIEKEEEIIFVAIDENDKMLGHIFLEILPIPKASNLYKHKTIYIDDLCVKEETRGKHVGKVLYDYVIDYAKKNGFYNITLNVWEGNDSARKFYEKMGMKIKETNMEYIVGDKNEKL